MLGESAWMRYENCCPYLLIYSNGNFVVYALFIQIQIILYLYLITTFLKRYCTVHMTNISKIDLKYNYSPRNFTARIPPTCSLSSCPHPYPYTPHTPYSLHHLPTRTLKVSASSVKWEPIPVPRLLNPSRHRSNRSDTNSLCHTEINCLSNRSFL